MDRWSEQSIWDVVLSGLQVVVSTHAILSDALSHGFVRMKRLALIIFDEGKMVSVQRNLYLRLCSSSLYWKPSGQSNHEGFLPPREIEVRAGERSAHSRPHCQSYCTIEADGYGVNPLPSSSMTH